jgi:pyruvate dehydrogenase E2 component (dihydrolipoamide acetyltransferase)
VALEKITIPDLGDSKDVEVIEILVSPGDEIQENDSLLTLETDKAAMEIPATSAGIVKEVLVKVGDTVNQGDAFIMLESAGESKPAEEKPEEKKTAPEPEQKSEKTEVATVEEPAAATSGEIKTADIQVPDLGTDDAVEIIDILVKEGDEVKADDGLLTLETDKAAMDVPAPFAGKITGIKVKIGDKVKTGTVIMVAETLGASASTPATKKTETKEKPAAAVASPSSAPEASKSAASSAPATVITPESQEDVYAGPAVRKLARELGVDLRQVKGTGTKDRIVKEDVHAFVKNVMQSGGAAASGGGFALPVAKDIDFTQFGDIEEKEMSKLHQVTARNMAQNWLTVPHVTQFEEADVTELEDFRAAQQKEADKRGIKLSPLPFIVKACARALEEFPQFNVSLHSSGAKLIQKKYVHIGVAVATAEGLMVPVIRDANKKSVWDIAAEIVELSELAKNRKLTKEHMSGGCFTVSSLGNIGGVGFTPIVNSPEVGILGVSKTTVKPMWIDGEFKPRKMLPFSLSYDHRAVNGVDGGMFCQYLNGLLSDIRRMVL